MLCACKQTTVCAKYMRLDMLTLGEKLLMCACVIAFEQH